jgi:cobalt-zinc-cadmium efflux system protein
VVTEAMHSTRWSQRTRLSIVLTLNLCLIGALVVVGLMAGSVGVLAAAGDTVADSVGLLLGLLAVVLRDRNPDHPHAQRPVGVVALINSAALLVVTVLVAVESVRRLFEHATEVRGLPMLIVSVVSMLVLLAGAWVLGASAATEDLHMRSVLLDTLADAGAAAGVAVAGAIIAFSGRYQWLDPAIALVVCALVVTASVHLIINAVAALRGIDVEFDNDD